MEFDITVIRNTHIIGSFIQAMNLSIEIKKVGNKPTFCRERNAQLNLTSKHSCATVVLDKIIYYLMRS